MKENYSAFCDRMIKKYEGGYGWDKGDSGGPTKFGVTCYDLAEHRGQKMDSMKRWAPIVMSMPLSEAEDIYANKYAKKTRFNDLNGGKGTVMFDYGVNSGTARPIRVAQKMLGKTVNGVFSNSLKDAINDCDAKWFINGMKQERLTFMHNIKGGSMWQTFGRASEKPLGPAKGSDLPDIPLFQDPSWLRVDIVDNPKAKAEDTPDTKEEIAVAGSPGSMISRFTR
jgi:lysozyme family protein